MGSSHLFHYIGNLQGGSRNLYNKFEAHIHNLIGGSRKRGSYQKIKGKLVRTNSRTRVSKETLEHGGPQVNEGEMKISLGEAVDQGLLLDFGWLDEEILLIWWLKWGWCS